MDTGNKYRTARLLAGLTLHELSNRTSPKVSVTQLSLFERDFISLPPDKVKALEKMLRLQPEEVSDE